MVAVSSRSTPGRSEPLLPLPTFTMLFALATGVHAAAAAEQPARSSTAGFLRYADFAGEPYNVSYDKRSLLVNGERSYFASVGVHYPRFSEGQWDDIFLKAKNDGYNMVQTYFFHNAHQPKLSQWPWNMEGPANLTLFLEKAAKAGMFVDLRIGPYVCAEWSWGGYPYDLANVPGLVSRSDNPQWESYMRAVVLNVTREFRDFFADRGGPIALGQVENELHTSSQPYVDWCGQLAEETDVKIPWGMCNGNSATNTINTCNGGDCTSFIEENGQNGRVLIDQPALWTENWMGWFDDWGQSFPAGDWTTFESTEQSASKAYGILRWTARGGSHVNFYNWAGGNHFARNAGSSMVNYYYWKAPIAPDNIAQGPERRHMSRLYAAIRQVAAVVLSDEAQLHKQTNLTGRAVAFVYKTGKDSVVFLENQAPKDATLVWEGKSYTVPGKSTSILENGVAIFNSADVRSDGTAHTWTATSNDPLQWSSWTDESIVKTAEGLPAPSPPYDPWSGSALGRVVRSDAPMEQVNFSEYDSELLLYSRVVTAKELSAAVAGSERGSSAVPLVLQTANANAWTIFADGILVGSGWELGHHGGKVHLGRDDCTKDGGKNITLDLSKLRASTKTGDNGNARGLSSFLLTMLSTSVGIDNGGGISNTDNETTLSSTGVKGITSTTTGSVVLGGIDLTRTTAGDQPWVHQVGAVGEAKGVYTQVGAKKVKWTAAGDGTAPPMTWHMATFDAPSAVLAPEEAVTSELNATLNLDVTGLSRGRFYVNGFDLGRYWSKLCGETDMCQRYYPIPFDKLKRAGNILTVLDEMGASNLSAVRLAISQNERPPPPPLCKTSAGEQATMYTCGRTDQVSIVPSDKYHRIQIETSRLCLQDPLSSKGNSTWNLCKAGDQSQDWVIDHPSGTGQIHPRQNPAQCLDVFGQGKSTGTPIDVWKCNNGENQQWALKAGQFVSSFSKLCLSSC